MKQKNTEIARLAALTAASISTAFAFPCSDCQIAFDEAMQGCSNAEIEGYQDCNTNYAVGVFLCGVFGEECRIAAALAADDCHDDCNGNSQCEAECAAGYLVAAALCDSATEACVNDQTAGYGNCQVAVALGRLQCAIDAQFNLSSCMLVCC